VSDGDTANGKACDAADPSAANRPQGPAIALTIPAAQRLLKTLECSADALGSLLIAFERGNFDDVRGLAEIVKDDLACEARVLKDHLQHVHRPGATGQPACK
jgi:hypothetical protein